MSDKYFLDTNIFVYSVDNAEPIKKVKSQALITDAINTGNGIISWQVIQEFLNVSSRKSFDSIKPSDVKAFFQKILNPLCEIYPDMNLYQYALEIMDLTHYSFYDSLILASAVKGECTILYSEDFQGGQVIRGVEVVNPFSAD